LAEFRKHPTGYATLYLGCVNIAYLLIWVCSSKHLFIAGSREIISFVINMFYSLARLLAVDVWLQAGPAAGPVHLLRDVELAAVRDVQHVPIAHRNLIKNV
jgi:hypothetical protein